ncbi:uncharacterized protein ofcc1 [Oryzias melastigma]|uniref:uncharacterized protein ofcc1 n=1 Tax=Oryzias melastigma TaxID=30732 RepID=UPI00168D8036|nr:uncharacterized protein ofcc1 [Oryzias melastigma]
MDTSDRKLQQKALQQPKQKKSKSAEFLMGEEDSDTVVGIDNPAFDGEGSTELPPTWLGRKMRGDRPDSTLAAHHKKMELQAPAKERGNEHAQNYFDPSSAEQIDPRHHRTTGVSTKDELELTILNADENRLYERMAALLEDDDTSLDIPGTLQASRDDEVLEVKAGDLVLQRRLLLHSGGDASGSGPSQAHATAKTRAKGGELQAGRMEMGTVKTRTAEEVIPHYAQQLRERVQPDMITLGSLSLQQQQAQNKPLKMTEWEKRKKRLASLFTGNSEGFLKNASSPRDCDEALRPQPRLNTLFPCAESPSVSVLGGGQGDGKHGQMTALLESSALASRPLWPSDGSSLPQPVEVRVCCLRATRDKLPRGLYSIRVTLHSRLGGSTLAFRGLNKQQDAGMSTEPTEHRGRFYHNDLPINQSLFMNLPAACDVSPSMVLVFQLINLAGHSGHVSSTLSWGAFPICGPSFCLVQGKFKTPLLRGEPNQQMDQFRKIEAQICSDLDHWLCNLYFQVKGLPPGTSVQSELSMVALNPPAIKPEIHHDQAQPRPPSHSLLCPQPESQTQLCAGPSCRGEPVVLHSHQGSCLHLSADSACSSSSLPGKTDPLSGSSEGRSDPSREGAEGGNHCKKKPIKKTNSCGPSMSGRSAPPRQAGKHKTQTSTETLSAEEIEEYTFSLQSAPTGPSPPPLTDRVRIALCMLLSELGLPLLRQQHQQHLNGSWHDSVQQLGLIMLLLTLMWFARLYLHYCSQWLYLQAIAVPVNKFRFHAHTVELVYQSSLLHTREELAMVMVGPLTLNAVTFLLVLIRWGCQLIFGSLPSFMSKFIMAQGVWTVLDPLAVFAVDAVLGRLSYSPDVPVGDAAKLYWHFYRADRSGAAGVIITLFLYGVHFLLSITILSIYLLRFHNDGRMLDVFQRLTAKEGKYFLPQDLELSNQELSYIVKKAEQWRGFNGERRKVAVYDYVWTAEDVLSSTADPGEEPHMEAPPPLEGETSTHVIIYTLYVSGLKQRYRHFLRQPDGAIVEVIGEIDGDDSGTGSGHSAGHQKEESKSASHSIQLRKRKKPLSRFHRVEPLGGSGRGSSSALQDLHE